MGAGVRRKRQKRGGRRERQRRGAREWDAYFTVEAVLIFPLALYICIFILYSGFYIYDRCVAEQDAYRAALRGSSLYREDMQAVYNAAEDTLREHMEGKYAVADYDFSVRAQGGVSIVMEGDVNMPFQGLRLLPETGAWHIRVEAESRCINPVFLIRMYRQLKQEKE